MDTSPYNIEDKPSHVSLPTWEQFKASIRAAPNFNSADEIQRMHGASDAARTVAHALLAKSAAGYHALTGGDADADAALLGPKSISPEGQYVLHGAMDTAGNLGKATGISDLAHSLSSKYNAVQGAVEPLVQKYLGVAPAAAAHAAFEAAPQAAIPGLGEEKALAGATGNALEQLAAHHIQNGGSTFHPGTGTMPSSGYAVSLHPGRAQVLSTAPTGEDLGKYLEANKDAFTKDPAAHMGTWHDVNDSGNHYLDVSHVDPDLGSAMEKAKGANQKAIFDLGSFNEIPNPHYNAALDTQAGPVAADSPLAAESPLEFKATDPGRVHLNSSPAALEREGEAARRDAADAPLPEAAPDIGPMPPHNDSYVGNQAFAEGGEVGMLGDAIGAASRLPTPAGLAAKYADNPAAIDNFHNWAKQTTVTDPSGAPTPMYHNTDALNDFSAFRPYRGDIGSHFGTQGQANERGSANNGRVPPAVEENTRGIPVAKNQQSGQRTIPAYLSIQNPLRTPDLGEWGHEQLQRYLLDEAGAFDPNHKPGSGGSWRQPAVIAGIDPNAVQATQNNHQLRKVLQDAGYDGIVYQNNGEPNIPPAIQLARQGTLQKMQAFLDAPENKQYWQTKINNSDAAKTQFPEQFAQQQSLIDQHQLADQAYRRFYHAPDIQADSYIAFDPSQVKSAVGNTGEFDPATQDINHAAGGNVRGYADGGSAELGTIGDAIQQVSHLPLEATAAEAAPLAEHVAQYGGATYSPASGALHRSGTVTADPESTVALDHAPDPDEIHDFLMHTQDRMTSHPTIVLHITSNDAGHHFMRVGRHSPAN